MDAKILPVTSDRELLKMAAKAAGILSQWDGSLVSRDYPDRVWNPLADDGDEARLEATLMLCVRWHSHGVLIGPAECDIGTISSFFEHYSKHGGDKQAARRRAGVRAAAAIGAAK